MLSLKQLKKGISDYLNGRRDLDELEDWFSVESWNAHIWGSPALDRAVFDIEASFSKYQFEDASEEDLRQELAGTIAAFPPEDDVSDWLGSSSASDQLSVDQRPVSSDPSPALARPEPWSSVSWCFVERERLLV